MSSTALIPHGKAMSVGSEAVFARGEKKSLFKTLRNMFKMCRSIQRRQIKEINRVKLVRHEQKAARAAAGEVVSPGSEDNESEATARSFPMAG